MEAPFSHPGAMTPLFLAGLFEATETSWDRLTDVGPILARHEAMARDAAEQSMVLLKNDRGTLPFGRGLDVALLGPMATAQAQLFGPITIGPCQAKGLTGGYKEDYSCVKTLNDSVSRYAATVRVEAGVVNFTSTDESRIRRAVEAAKRADVVILALGAGLETVDEKEDLYGLGLPGAQDALAAAVAAVGKPTAAVLVMGNQYAIDAWLPDVPAVLDAFVPSGRAGADVVADTLFGENRRFGKLPYTLYERAYADDVQLADASMAQRGYRYYDGPHVSFPFGHGLTYNAVRLGEPTARRLAFRVDGRDSKPLSVRLSSDDGGDEVVQLYVAPGDVRTGARLPRSKLVDFHRVNVPPKGTADVHFHVAPKTFALVDAFGDTSIYPGTYTLILSTGNPDSPPRTVDVTISGHAPKKIDTMHPATPL